MTHEDIAEFSARLTEIAELYEAELSESKILLYFQALEDIDLDFVLGGLVGCAKICRFFPKPVEIRSLVLGNDEDHAELAWLEYKRQAREFGGYSSPDFADGALAQALVAVFGSWEAACWEDFTPEMWVAKRKEFGRVYRVMRARGDGEARRLVGFFERQQTGLSGREALKIGDGQEPERKPSGLKRFWE